DQPARGSEQLEEEHGAWRRHRQAVQSRAARGPERDLLPGLAVERCGGRRGDVDRRVDRRALDAALDHEGSAEDLDGYRRVPADLPDSAPARAHRSDEVV